MKRVLYIAASIAMAVVLLLLLLVGLTQTPMFKNRLRVTLISMLAPKINGTLQIGSIRGNLLTDLSADSVEVYYHNTLLLSVGSIRVYHDPLALLNRTISIKQLILDRVQLHFSRSPGGVWNMNDLLIPSNDSGGSSSPWSIDVENLELRNADFSLVDSLTLAEPEHGEAEGTIEYHNFTVENITMHAAAHYHPNDALLTISSGHAHANMPEFKPLTFAGRFQATAKGLNVDHLYIKTAKSDLRLDGEVKNANIFAPLTSEMLRSDPASIRLSAKKIDLGEIASFFPDADLLTGQAAVELDASGVFGNIKVSRLNVQTKRSMLRLTGSVRNLQQPEQLALNVSTGDSRIDPADISEIFANESIPKFLDAGPQALTLQYAGTLRSFKTALHLAGRGGVVSVSGDMDLSDAGRYDLKFAAEHFKPGLFLTMNTPMVFTGGGTIRGEGFNPDSMIAHLDVAVDSVEARGLRATNSHFIVDAQPRQFAGSATVNMADMNAQVSGAVDLRIPKQPVIRADITTHGVDLARILNDSTMRSSLTLTAAVSSSGMTVDNLTGETSINFGSSSSFHGIDLSNTALSLHLDQQDIEHKSLSLRSAFADADLRGKFDLDIIQAYMTEQIPNLFNTMINHTAVVETTMAENRKAETTIQKHTGEQKDVDFTYRFQFHSLAPLARFAGTTPFDAQGSMAGTVHGNARMLSITDTSAFDTLRIGADTSALQLQNVALKFDVRDIAATRTLETLGGNWDLSIQNGTYGTKPLANVHGKASFGNSRSTFSFGAEYDSVYVLSLAGSAAVEPHSYSLDFDTLRFAARNTMLRNGGDIQARIDTGGIRIMHAIISNHNDFLSLSGVLKRHGGFDATASLRQFPLQEINTLLYPASSGTQNIGFTGATDADVRLSGTPAAPIFDLTATIDSATYRESSLGQVGIKIAYAGRHAHVDIAARTAPTDSLPKLTLFGDFPVDLAFNSVEKRFPDTVQQLHLHSDGYQLGILETLLPELQNLSGTLTGDLNISGTPAHPAYSGLLSIADARFTFAPNNLPYILAGNLVPAGDTVALKNFSIRNAPEEKVGGSSRIEGYLLVKNFALEHFDLTLFGDLLVMSDASRATMPTLYGELFTQMGPNGLHFNGSIDHPNLSGTLLIKEANLTFPPTRTEILTSATLPYIIIDDTTKGRKPAHPAPVKHQLITRRGDNAEPEQVRVASPSKETFVSKLRYNLSIETQGLTRIRMVFTPSTNEELYAEITGTADAINENGTPEIYGDIALGQNSYYNFIKRFAASGSLQFTGPWDNPEMNVTATYTGNKQLTAADTARSKGPIKVIVTITITGTRYEPKPTMDMKIQDDPTKDPVDWASTYHGGDVQSNALSFILTGKFRDELTSADNATVSDLSSSTSNTLVSGFTSSFLSDIMTRFLQQEFPFIQSASISYKGTESDVRINSQLAKGYLSAGGQVLNDIGNANVSYLVSLGDLIDARTLRNLFIELEHRVEGTPTDEARRSATTNTARVYYKISF